MYFPSSYSIYSRTFPLKITNRIYQVRGGQSNDQKHSKVNTDKISVFHDKKELLTKKKSRNRKKTAIKLRRKPPSLSRMFKAFIVTLYDPTFGGTISISPSNNSFLRYCILYLLCDYYNIYANYVTVFVLLVQYSSFSPMGDTFQSATAGSFGPVCGPGGCC